MSNFIGTGKFTIHSVGESLVVMQSFMGDNPCPVDDEYETKCRDKESHGDVCNEDLPVMSLTLKNAKTLHYLLGRMLSEEGI